MKFSNRSEKKELLDEAGIPAADIRRNMIELSVINEQLGGHAITRKGFYRLAGNRKNLVCEIGCGGGDNLKAIENKYGDKKGNLSFIGIDINKDCIRTAQMIRWKNPVEFIVKDYRQVNFPAKPDIIFCSLFCHHFKENELIEMFQWMRSHSTTGFFINDLHRNPFAYYAIRLLTTLFSKSYLVRHDAPLSVLRGFSKKELTALLDQAGIRHYSIEWKWAFRWLIVVQH